MLSTADRGIDDLLLMLSTALLLLEALMTNI